jgi:hypothetical protein
MKFQTNECPLCGKVLHLKKVAGVSVYSCLAEAKSHYEVEMDSQAIIQHMYVFPYAIDNYDNANRSRVHRWKNNRWSFMKEVTRIQPRPAGELLGHLQTILPIVGTPIHL